jgi:hypothetical protein
MRTKFLTLFSLVLIGLFLAEPAFGQRNPYKRRRGGNKKVSKYRGSTAGKFRPYEYLTYGVNALNYYGDLAPLARAASSDISFTRPGTGVTYGLRFNPGLAIRANYNFGRIKGDDISSQDQSRYTRNLSFRNNIHEFNVGANFYFLADNNSATYRSPINIYLFVGGGFFLHEPKGKVPQYDYQTYGPTAEAEGAPVLENAGEWVKLRELKTEGQGGDFEGAPEPYKPFQWQVPINAGVELAIPRTYLSVGLEFGFRYIFTDYLDDVSNKYVALDRFEDETARIMSDRSMELISANEIERDFSLINYNQLDFNGTPYYYAVDIGSGFQNSVRGNPESNDTYFLTQIKIKLILPPDGLFKNSRKSNAKFR